MSCVKLLLDEAQKLSRPAPSNKKLDKISKKMHSSDPTFSSLLDIFRSWERSPLLKNFPYSAELSVLQDAAGFTRPDKFEWSVTL